MPAVENNEHAKRFEIRSDGEVAFLTYRLEKDTIALTHTAVPEALEGRGYASALAAAGFDYARSHHLRVDVVCAFVAGWLGKHPEQLDIVV